MRGGLTLLLFFMYISSADDRRRLCARPPEREAPEPLHSHLFQVETQVLEAFCPAPLGANSHLLQGVAYFDPLSLDGRLRGPSRRVCVAAQVAHLIGEGCI